MDNWIIIKRVFFQFRGKGSDLTFWLSLENVLLQFIFDFIKTMKKITVYKRMKTMSAVSILLTFGF